MRVPVGLQADDVVRQQTLADHPPQRLGQHHPGINGRPRDVVEVQQQAVGALLADARCGQVEVIVLEHDDRPLRAPSGFDHGVGEDLIDHAVAGLPRGNEVAVDDRRIGQRVELMLGEPQERVGDRAVVLLPRVVGQLAHVEVQVLLRQLALDPGRQVGPFVVAALTQDARGGAVTSVHRGTDPGHRCDPAHLSERRNQAAGATPDVPAGACAAERQRAAVGHDDQAAVLADQRAEVFAQLLPVAVVAKRSLAAPAAAAPVARGAAALAQMPTTEPAPPGRRAR